MDGRRSRRGKGSIQRVAVYSVLHLLVDGLCALAMFGVFLQREKDYLYSLLYNFCAFAMHAMVRALGGRVGCFCLTGTGAVIRPRRERLFSYWEECLVALSGPMASFLLAILAGAWGAQFGSPDAYLLTGLSLALGLFNLLPMGPLDGGRTVKAILAWLTGPDRGDQLSGVLSKTVAAALTGAGLWWFLQGGNFTLLLFALWLLLRRERREGRSFFHSKR